MIISLVQYDILWEDKKSNLAKIERFLNNNGNSPDIIILPEMFSSGFSMNADRLAETEQGDTLKWMTDLARRSRASLCGSFIVSENGSYFNRFISVSEAGSIECRYDKRHLFSIGSEERYFTRGSSRTLFNIGDFRILPSICYDLRFPVWLRNRNDYDLLICVANWPESRREVWKTLLRARAIENQCFVAAVNRTGADGNGISYCGDSVIIGPKGETVAEAQKNAEQVITADISMDYLSDFRASFPVWRDADEFSLK